MTRDQEQPSLWQEDELAAARFSLAAARERWRDIRLHHAAGSTEEVHAWTAYRTASDPVWRLLRRRATLIF